MAEPHGEQPPPTADPERGRLHARGGAGPAYPDLESASSLLSRASRELTASLTLNEALTALASLVVPDAADWFAVDLVEGDGGLRRVALEHQDPTMVQRVEELERQYPRDLTADRGAPRVIRTGESEWAETIDPGLYEMVARDSRHMELLRALQLSSYVTAPLIARGRTLGALTMVYAESGRRYSEEGRLLVEDLAARMALALDNIRLIEELEAARRRVEEQAGALEEKNAQLEGRNRQLRAQADQLGDALGRVEEQYREKDALLASTADGVYGIDPEGRCTFMNAAAGRMLQLDPDGSRGQNMHRLIHHTRPDGRPYPEEECPIFLAFRNGESVRVDDDILWRADGSSFRASYSSSPVVQDDEVVGAVVTFTDESERRSTENRVQLLGRILDESLNEIYVFEAESLKFVQVNRGGRENLGYTMDELRAMTPLDLKPEFSWDTFQQMLEPLRTGEQAALRFETVHLRADGSEYPVEVNLQLARGAERPVFVAVILDITERRQADAERERLIADLEEANRVKAEFVSTMSHELRTPLNAVLGYAQLLEDGIPVTIPDPALSHVRRINLSARHLLQLIDEILAFSKLEAGREAASTTRIELPDLVEEVRAVVEPLATDKQLEFTTTTANLPERFVSDPRKLRQVLLNLTGNAVKFTQQGTVTLEARGRGSNVEFVVRDTGIGIRPEDREQAFEPFWQADQSSTREAGGTGLGLAITRQFVDILGGSIELQSEVGVGTTFTIRLPSLPLEGGVEESESGSAVAASGGRSQ